MLLAEEFLLACLDERTGRLRLGRDKLDPALAGALLVELAQRDRIGVTPEEAGWSRRRRLTVLSTAPTGDGELDRALAAASAGQGRRVKDLIASTSSRRISRGLRLRLLDRLATAGVLERRQRRLLGLFPSTTWSHRDRVPADEVRQRLHAALVLGLTPTPRTTALVALLRSTGALTKVLDGPDRAALRRRADELSRGEWVGRAVKQAIDTATAVVVSASGG